MSRAKLAAFWVLAALSCACGSSDDAGGRDAGGTIVPESCDDGVKVASLCPGVPVGDACTRARACAETCGARTSAGSDAEVASASTSAKDGDCLELAAGKYGQIAAPPGVSVLGDGAGSVEVESISVSGNAVVRGVTVAGIDVAAGSKVKIDRVRVKGAPVIGISATDAAIEIVDSTVETSGGYGIAIECRSACAVASITRTVVSGNTDVGILIRGTDATALGVIARDTGPKDFQRGRGIEVMGGALSATQTQVVDNADAGVVVFSGGGTLGPGFVVRNNLRGVHLQSPASAVTFDGFDVSANRGIGIGIDGSAVGIIIQNGDVAGTELATIPTVGGGSDQIGDGIEWLGGAIVTVDRTVTVSSSARSPLVIDASTQGSFSAALAGGDEAGIIIQNVPSPTEAPTVAAGISVDFTNSPVPVGDELSESTP